jgi:two-component system, chemotaxis family, sensor kinase Cph1
MREGEEAEMTGMQPTHQFTDRQLSEFLLRVCHDLKTPVRAIRAHSELFLRGGEASDLTERLGFVVDGARKIDQIVEGLSGFAIALQIDPVSFQPTSMGVVLRSVLAKLKEELRHNDAEVTYGEMPRVLGSPDRLMQLLENLLRNAVQHCGAASPRVDISAERSPGGWLFAVKDNGPGVEADYLERMFKPFERGQGGHRAGTGMGLAICRIIVERHGGKVWAESEAGGGTTLVFILPAAD